MQRLCGKSITDCLVLVDEINDNEPNNSTRFIVVTNQKIFLKEAEKISICFEAAP